MTLAVMVATLATGFGKHLEWHCPDVPAHRRLLAVAGYALVADLIGTLLFGI